MKEGHCLGDQVLRFCDRRDLRPTVSFRSAQLETIQALVVAGMGISFIPAMARKPDGDGAPQYRSLQLPKPQREIVALWPKQRPPGRPAAAFLESIAGSILQRVGKRSPFTRNERFQNRSTHGEE
jgi:LysR family hydrogen peroxide-inducible transcriptional activator